MNTSNILEKRYFNTVKTCSVQRWIDSTSDGDLMRLRINPKKGNPKQDEQAYEDLMNDYLREFGISPHLQKIVNKRIELAKVLQEYLKYPIDNRILLNDIEVLRLELKGMESLGGDSLIQIVGELARNGVSIDLKKDSIYKLEYIIRKKK